MQIQFAVSTCLVYAFNYVDSLYLATVMNSTISLEVDNLSSSLVESATYPYYVYYGLSSQHSIGVQNRPDVSTSASQSNILLRARG